MCIRSTCDSKSIPIQCISTIQRYISILIVPLIAIGTDQPSNIYYYSNSDDSVYGKHLNDIGEETDTIHMSSFLMNMTNDIFLYISSYHI